MQPRTKPIRVDATGYVLGVWCHVYHSGNKRIAKAQSNVYACQGCGHFFSSWEVRDALAKNKLDAQAERDAAAAARQALREEADAVRAEKAAAKAAAKAAKLVAQAAKAAKRVEKANVKRAAWAARVAGKPRKAA